MTLSDLLARLIANGVSHFSMTREKEEALRDLVDAIRQAETEHTGSADFRDFTSGLCQTIRGNERA